MQPRRSCPRLELPTTEHSNQTTTPMTTRGKFILTLLIIGVVGFGVYRWWDKIAPAGKSQQGSGNFQELKKNMDSKPSPEKAAADVASKLLAGDKAVSLVDGSAIPPVS